MLSGSLATGRLLRISPGSTIPYKHSPFLPTCHPWHHFVPTLTRNSEDHKVFPCQLFISPIPQPAYIPLLIFFYHMIPLIMPLLIINFVILWLLVLFLVFLLSCFCHQLHSSTNVPQVPSAHITFRYHTFMFVLTENGQRQVWLEIALVDTFSHALSAFCQSSTKGLG